MRFNDFIYGLEKPSSVSFRGVFKIKKYKRLK